MTDINVAQQKRPEYYPTKMVTEEAEAEAAEAMLLTPGDSLENRRKQLYNKMHLAIQKCHAELKQADGINRSFFVQDAIIDLEGVQKSLAPLAIKSSNTALGEADGMTRNTPTESIVGAETVQKGLAPYATQVNTNNIDMNSLMLEVTKLLSKLRDQQYDHSAQQRLQGVKMQEKVFVNEKESIKKNQKAATVTMGFGMASAGLGVVTSGTKGGGAIKKARAESAQSKVTNLMQKEGKSATEAFDTIKENRNWFSKLNKHNVGNSSTLEGIEGRINTGNKMQAWGDALSGVAPIPDAVGKFISTPLTTEAQQLKVEADRDKGLQHSNEREQGIRDEQARDSSSRLRSFTQQLVELFGKYAATFRFA